MKSLTTLVISCLLTISCYSQQSPYSMFGDNSEVLKSPYEAQRITGFEIVNNDSCADVESIFFMFDKGLVEIHYRTGQEPELQRISKDVVARWMSMDPLFYEAPGWAPYRFAFDNPIFWSDPTGLFEDNYTIDDSGVITKVEDTDDDFDMLYTEDAYNSGDLTGGIKVEDQTLLSELSGFGTVSATRGEENADDVFEIFQFAANNSGDVEWMVARLEVDGEDQYVVGTLHDVDYSPGWGTLGIDESSIVAWMHSHPSTGEDKYLYSMGIMDDGSVNDMQYSDWHIVIDNYYDNDEEDPFNYYIYFPETEDLYNLKAVGAEYIRNINDDHTRFYFGTLK